MQSINVIRITDSYTMKSILWHSLRVVLISGIFKAFEWIKVDRRDWEIEKWNVWKANSIVKSVARFIFVSPLLRPRIIRRWMVVDKLAVHFYAMEKKREIHASKPARICWIDLHSLREQYCKYLLRKYFPPNLGNYCFVLVISDQRFDSSFVEI